MSFIGFSPDYFMEGSTSIENIYISEYLPNMPDVINKIYIYGLFLCNAPDTPDNSLSSMALRMGVDEAVVLDSFTYLQGLGLVRILNKTPFEVRYLNIKNIAPIKKYKPEKYAEFNIRIQEILTGRMISVREFNEYYDLIEALKLEKEVVLMAAKYAVSLKGENINYPYILAILRNWAQEGITTVAKAEEKLLEYDSITDRILQLFKAMGIKRSVNLEDRECFIRWTKGMDFAFDTLIHVAKKCKKGGITKLDTLIKKYYESKLYSIEDIEAYENNKQSLFDTAKVINRAIGVYYEQLDNVVDTYIVVWLNMGFNSDALELIANACFKKGIKTLEGMNDLVGKFYKQGLLSADAIGAYLERMSGADDKIREILDACKSAQSITARMRDSYRTWTYSWGMPHELVLYCASLAVNAEQPIPYLNKILSDWNLKGIKTLEDAKKQSAPFPASLPNQTAIVKRSYTPEQLAALIDNIDDLEF